MAERSTPNMDVHDKKTHDRLLRHHVDHVVHMADHYVADNYNCFDVDDDPCFDYYDSNAVADNFHPIDGYFGSNYCRHPYSVDSDSYFAMAQ